MNRPDINTLACVNEECHLFKCAGAGNLVIRKVYGKDGIRLLQCRECGEEFSARQGSALFNTKIAERRAEAVIEHLDEGCSVSGTARLVKVSKDTVARLLRRHAKKFHDAHVQGLTPKVLEFDEQWSFVKKSSGAVMPMRARSMVICGTM